MTFALRARLPVQEADVALLRRLCAGAVCGYRAVGEGKPRELVRISTRRVCRVPLNSVYCSLEGGREQRMLRTVREMPEVAMNSVSSVSKAGIRLQMERKLFMPRWIASDQTPTERVGPCSVTDDDSNIPITTQDAHGDIVAVPSDGDIHRLARHAQVTQSQFIKEVGQTRSI